MKTSSVPKALSMSGALVALIATAILFSIGHRGFEQRSRIRQLCESLLAAACNQSASGDFEKLTSRATPTVVLFVVNLSCEHCYQQIELFSKRIESSTARLVIVSPETPAKSQIAMFHASFVTDPRGTWARKFELPDDPNLHATIVIKRGRVLLEKVAEKPFMDIRCVMNTLEE